MLYELRTYEAGLGNGAVLRGRLQRAAALFKKYGLTAHGVWSEVIGCSDRTSYMWEYEDLSERNKKLEALRADPTWNSANNEENAKYGEVTSKVHNTIMELTDYSPKPDFSVNNVHELRIYHAVPNKLPALNQRFANHADRLLRKHGLNVVGYWTDLVGTTNRLIWMVGFDSLAHREQCWTSYRTEPEWPKVRDESIKDGEIVAGWENWIFKRLGF